MLLVPLALAKLRVEHRVAAGGHTVPVDKIESRYRRLWGIVATAIERSDTSSCWDNSAYAGPVKVAAFTAGDPDAPPTWPAWAPSAFTARWPS